MKQKETGLWRFRVSMIKKKQSSKEKWKQRRKKSETHTEPRWVCVRVSKSRFTHAHMQTQNITPKQIEKKERFNKHCGVRNLNVKMLLKAKKCHQNVIIDAELFSIFISFALPLLLLLAFHWCKNMRRIMCEFFRVCASSVRILKTRVNSISTPIDLIIYHHVN